MGEGVYTEKHERSVPISEVGLNGQAQDGGSGLANAYRVAGVEPAISGLLDNHINFHHRRTN